jgi:homoserine acetyltransferase
MAQAEQYDSTGVEYYAIPSLNFACGTTLHDVNVAYRSFNSSSTEGTVLIPTCYAGIINSTLTWTTAPNDCLAKYRVVVVAMLGNGESASPSNKSMFPEPGDLRYQDLINAQHALLTQHLGINSLEAVIGFSMGGQQAYHWSVMYPGFMKRMVAICSSARTSPHNYAFLEGPIEALMQSIDYVAVQAVKQKAARGEDVGHKLKEVKPKRGLRAFGRAYGAWLSSTHWFRDRLWGKVEGGLGFGSVEEWMSAREAAYLGWDADDLLVLARMWQLGDIGTVVPGDETLSQLGGGTGDDEKLRKALQSIRAKVLLLPCQTDQYFPPEDSQIEVTSIQQGRCEPIPSVWGHMAGGGANAKDTAWLNERIQAFMGA